MNNLNKSLWRQTAPKLHAFSLQGDFKADVVVVGAGLTGMTTAVLLAQSGKNVIVLESADLGAGTSGDTTAHITDILDTRYHHFVSRFGEDVTRKIADAHRLAIDQIAILVRTYDIDCDFEWVKGYLYTQSADEIEDLYKELETLQKVRFPAEQAPQSELPIEVAGAIRVANQAQFHPLRYLAGLAQTLKHLNGRIYTQSHVIDVIESHTGVHVKTEHGSIKAKNLVWATHIPPGINLVDTEVAPYRSYVMAFKSPAQVENALYWDTEDPYHYFRTYKQNGDSWLIVGGYDHKTGQESDTEGQYWSLENYAREQFGIDEPVARWSGQVYEPVDGLAYIGESPLEKHTYFATGYAGNGMTYATIAARLITDLILGRQNPLAKIFDPARLKVVASAAEFVKENVNVAAHFLGDRICGHSHELSHLTPGTGEVVKLDGELVAAYRHDDGELSLHSAICPHLKCVVGWNNAEKTWDCPCHGGRFDAEGKWIEGPPKQDLAEVKEMMNESANRPMSR